MKKKSGFTLVEVITAVFILCIVIVTSVKFHKILCDTVNVTEYQSSTDVNLRIAQEFMVDKVRRCNTIVAGGGNYYIDGNKLFVQNNILRYGTASQQVSPDIIKVSIEMLEKDIYRISTIGAFEEITTVIKRGDSIE